MKAKPVNLALQGGGSHGAFTWGVLDRLLEVQCFSFEAICATSAGSMNAIVAVFGAMQGGGEGARQALYNFWKDVSRASQFYSPLTRMPWEKPTSRPSSNALSYMGFEALTRMFSPYQFNPLGLNPLRDILASHVDFDTVHDCRQTQLFISTTNVHTGNPRVFTNQEITLDVVMASACLPYLFQAVEIEGEYYWDGGYMGNPSLFPLVYHRGLPRDIVIVHINPVYRSNHPTEAPDIINRINEISFNASLIKELRHIDFVQNLIEQDWIKPAFRQRIRRLYVHSIRADEALAPLDVSSKFDSSWKFLLHLRDLGRHQAQLWLEGHFDDIGHCATVDLSQEFLQAHEPIFNKDSTYHTRS
jgi:NTE family protein